MGNNKFPFFFIYVIISITNVRIIKMEGVTMKKIKTIARRVATCMLALVLTVSFSLPSSFNVMTKKVSADEFENPVAENVQYYPNNDVPKKERTGIKSFELGKYSYYNMSKDTNINPDGDATMSLDNPTLRRICAHEIFPKWSLVAEELFRNQANQLVTINGTGMMSQDKSAKNSFDRHFSTELVGGNGYKDDWALKDLSMELRGSDFRQEGKTGNDEMRREGISQVSSLADARKMMGQSLRNCSNNNNLSVDDFLGNSYQQTEGKYRLPDLNNTSDQSTTKETNGFCNVVTCVNRQGASFDYDYVTFGLLAYDFDLVPVAAQGLKFVEAADKYDDGEDILKGKSGELVDRVGIRFSSDKENGKTSYLKNSTDRESTQTTGLENAVSASNTITHEDSFQFNMEQNISFGWNLGTYGSEATLLPRGHLDFSFTFGELWEHKDEQSQTTGTEKKDNVNTEVTLPPHTIAKVNQSLENTNIEENYQQPVVLNYKVAIFAMSGDYFNGANGAIKSNIYDKQWMSVIFDGSDRSANCGCNALGSLYSRAIDNADSPRYDASKGRYKTYCDKSAWKVSEKINWNSVNNELAADTRESHNIKNHATGQKSTLKNMATELSLMEKAMMLNTKEKNTTVSVDEVIPLFPLGSVSLKGDKQFNVKPNEKVYLDNLELEGFDNGDVPFHGFQKKWGVWRLLDEDNNVIEDGSAKDKDGEKNGRVKYGVLTLYTNEDMDSQWIQIANSSEFEEDTPSQMLKWTIKDDAEIVSNENLVNSEPYMTPEQIANVSVPRIIINPKDDSKKLTAVELSGNFRGVYTDKVNLNSVLKAKPIDENGAKKNIQVLWEDNGEDGINLEESGIATFTKPGIYKVKAYAFDNEGKKVASDWIEIQVVEKAKLSRIDFNKPADLDDEDLTITKNHRSRGFDLDSCIDMYDQYGEKWTGEKPNMKYSVTDSDGEESSEAIIDTGNVLKVTSPGTYKVKAIAVDENGEDLGFSINSFKVKVTEEEWLESILFEEPNLSKNQLKLEDKNDEVLVEGLRRQIRYLNQHGEEWDGKKPNVTFSLMHETDGAEIKGDSFYGYKPGTYKIAAKANGYTIDPIMIKVEEDPHLVIKTEDPDTIKIDNLVEPVSLDIERYVDFTTQFDGKFDEGRPALEYSLDSGIEDACIVTEKERNVDTGEVYDIVRFKASAPGEYKVHVTPKKASAYTEPIDDINVKVEVKKEVSYITLNFATLNVDKADRTLNNGECVVSDLDQYLEYYDQFGRVLSPQELDVIDDIPEVTGYRLAPDDKNATIEKDAEGRYVFTAKETGAYMITPIYKDSSGEEAQIFGEVINIIDSATAQEMDDAIFEGQLLLNRVHEAKASGKITEDQERTMKEAFNLFVGEVNNSRSIQDINEAKGRLMETYREIFPEEETTTEQTTTTAETTTTKAKVPTKVGKTKVKKAIKKSAKKIKVTLKATKGANGYQVAVYKTKKNAKANKKALVKKYFKGTKVKLTVKSKKIKGKKKVFVRARAYVLKGTKRIFGEWSKVKKSKKK